MNMVKHGKMATDSSILAWEIPWREEPGKLKSIELQRVKHNLATKQHIPQIISRHFKLTKISQLNFHCISFICYSISTERISVQFSSITQSCPTLCGPMNCSTPGLPCPSPAPGVHSNSRPLCQ